jgi:hypothetical protein
LVRRDEDLQLDSRVGEGAERLLSKPSGRVLILPCNATPLSPTVSEIVDPGRIVHGLGTVAADALSTIQPAKTATPSAPLACFVPNIVIRPEPPLSAHYLTGSSLRADPISS